MFYSDYKHIINRLPNSLVKRIYQSLLNYSKNPILLEKIFEKSDQVESYLKYKLKVYKNSLNRKCKNITQKKLLHS